MIQLNRVLTIVFLVAAGHVRANSQTNSIDALVEKLNSSPLWINSYTTIIELPSNATPQEVVASAVGDTFRILETRKVRLNDMPDCSAALIETDLGMKILLFKFEGTRNIRFKDMWWTRLFDAPETAESTAYKLAHGLIRIIIPELNYRETKPSEVFTFLSDETKRLDPNHVGVNFIVQGEIDETNAVTLSLHNVPLINALKYICQLAGLSYRTETNGVIISKTPAVSPAAAPSPP